MKQARGYNISLIFSNDQNISLDEEKSIWEKNHAATYLRQTKFFLSKSVKNLSQAKIKKTELDNSFYRQNAYLHALQECMAKIGEIVQEMYLSAQILLHVKKQAQTLQDKVCILGGTQIGGTQRHNQAVIDNLTDKNKNKIRDLLKKGHFKQAKDLMQENRRLGASWFFLPKSDCLSQCIIS